MDLYCFEINTKKNSFILYMYIRPFQYTTCLDGMKSFILTNIRLNTNSGLISWDILKPYTTKVWFIINTNWWCINNIALIVWLAENQIPLYYELQANGAYLPLFLKLNLFDLLFKYISNLFVVVYHESFSVNVMDFFLRWKCVILNRNFYNF